MNSFLKLEVRNDGLANIRHNVAASNHSMIRMPLNFVASPTTNLSWDD